MLKRTLSAIAALTVMIPAVATAASITVDDFTVAQAVADPTGFGIPDTSSTVLGPTTSIIGGARYMEAAHWDIRASPLVGFFSLKPDMLSLGALRLDSLGHPGLLLVFKIIAALGIVALAVLVWELGRVSAAPDEVEVERAVGRASDALDASDASEQPGPDQPGPDQPGSEQPGPDQPGPDQPSYSA